MNSEEEIPLEYRRYSANLNLKIKSVPAESADVDEDATGDATDSEIASAKEPPLANASPPPLPPLIRFRQLQSKLKDNIDDLNTLNEFIRLGYKLGEFEPIEDSMRRYLARHPRHNATRYSLAMLLIRSGKREKAPKELRKILQYNPKFHQARQLLERMRKKEI